VNVPRCASKEAEAMQSLKKLPEKRVTGDSDVQQFLIGWCRSWNPTIDRNQILIRMPLETSMKASESKY